MTPKQEAAMRDALNALLRVQPQVRGAIPQQDVEDAIDSLRAALAEPAQEPVAWQCSVCGGGPLLCLHNQTDVPLYAEPPQRRPLSDEEIYAAIKGIDSLKAVEVARAVEKAHGIGE